MNQSYSPILPSESFLQATLGAWHIGAVASVGLLGVLSLQSWTYFLRFPRDPRILKVLVLTVWATVFVKCTMSVHAGYFLTVVKWGNLAALLKPIWSMEAMILVSTVTTFLVHLFFAHKVWILTRKRYWWIPVIVLFFSLAHLVLGTATFYAASIRNNYEDILFGLPKRFATAGLGCAIIADLTITTSLVIFLRAEKGPSSEIGLTKNFINTLIFYAINIGLLVSLVDLVIVVLLNTLKSLNLYQLMLFELIGNLYANTLLACLNMRSAPSSLELSELVKTQHYPPISYDRTLKGHRSFLGSRNLFTEHGYEPDSSILEIGKGGPYPLTTGTVPDYKNTPSSSSSWRSESVVKCPEIVVTKTTVTTVI